MEFLNNFKIENVSVIDSCLKEGIEIKEIIDPYCDINLYLSVKEFQVSIGSREFPNVLIIGLHDNPYHLGSAIRVLREFVPIIIVIASKFTDEVRKECLMSGAMKVLGKEHISEIPFNIKSFCDARNKRLQTTQITSSNRYASG